MTDPDDCIHRMTSAAIQFCFCHDPRMTDAELMARCREYLADYTREVLQGRGEGATMSNYRQALERIAAIHRDWIDGNWETCECSSCQTYRIAREALAEGEHSDADALVTMPRQGYERLRAVEASHLAMMLKLESASAERDRLHEENEAMRDAARIETITHARATCECGACKILRAKGETK